jgi:hypothetical protein
MPSGSPTQSEKECTGNFLQVLDFKVFQRQIISEGESGSGSGEFRIAIHNGKFQLVYEFCFGNQPRQSWSSFKQNALKPCAKFSQGDGWVWRRLPP